MSAAFVLATDLDGTFAHGTAEGRDRLVAWLRGHPAATLVYITGRSPGGVARLRERRGLPEPDLLVADVGTSVLRGFGPERVTELEEALGEAWPGEAEIRRRLSGVEGIEPQEIRAPRRVSYWVEPVRRRREEGATRDGAGNGGDPWAARDPGDDSLDEEAETLAAEVAAGARVALAGLPVDVLVSANLFLDVLPRGVNKGSTLLRVLRWLGADPAACVVAGDSLNDLALFETGLRGVAVGNCEPALRRSVAALPDVYVADAEGVEGVIEGLAHHGHSLDPTDGGRHGQ